MTIQSVGCTTTLSINYAFFISKYGIYGKLYIYIQYHNAIIWYYMVEILDD